MADHVSRMPMALPPFRSSDEAHQGPHDVEWVPGRPGAVVPDVLYAGEQRLPLPPPAHPRMAVVGVGGGGSNVLRQMPTNGVVRRIALNTDAQALPLAQADERHCLGEQLTRGRGTGGVPDVGARAAEASHHHVLTLLRGMDLVFITAGLGGGTGTGAAPVVARQARELGALVIGLATLPFTFEGSRRRQVALAGLAQLEAAVDALFVIPNDRLLQVTGQQQALGNAFALADEALAQGVAGIVEIVTIPGLINVDFADIRAILQGAGRSLLAIGEACGQDRAMRAVHDALSGGWLDASIHGADRLLLNLTAPPDLTLSEVTEVTAQIARQAVPGVHCVFGTVIDPLQRDTLRLTLVAAGLPPSRDV